MRYIGICTIINGSLEPTDEQDPIGNDNEVYEVLRVYHGKPLFINDHLKRWTNSMTAVGRQTPNWLPKLPQLIDWLVACNSIHDCDIRITASQNGTVQCGFIETTYPTEQQFRDGVKCQLLNAERQSPDLKIFHSAMRHDAHTQQEKTDSFESLLVNKDGQLTEGSRSNLYFIDELGVVHTAPDGTVLGGIMRRKVLDLCQKENIPVNLHCVEADKIADFKAAFLSSTPMQALPVNKIADTAFDTNDPTLRKIVDGIDNLIKSATSC